MSQKCRPETILPPCSISILNLQAFPGPCYCRDTGGPGDPQGRTTCRTYSRLVAGGLVEAAREDEVAQGFLLQG
jgi:hypothetical protein